MKEVISISVQELSEMAVKMAGIVKAVIDIDQHKMVVDAEMHADEEEYLLEQGSNQADLWGINLHPDAYGTDGFIVFDSMINIRPRQGNRSRSVENESIQAKLREIVAKVVQP